MNSGSYFENVFRETSQNEAEIFSLRIKLFILSVILLTLN